MKCENVERILLSREDLDRITKNLGEQITKDYQGKKLLYEAFGEMLFTHFGVSGPLMLSASSVVNDAVRKQPLQLYIDWKPALSEEQLDHRILRDFEEAKNRQVIHADYFKTC